MRMTMTARRLAAAVTVAAATATLYAQNPAVTVTIDVSANRRAINPAIYGVAYATAH